MSSKRRPRSFHDIIELWSPSEGREVAATLLARELGLPPNTVLKWWQRNSIPSGFWARLLVLPRAADGGVTAELLTDLAARDRRVA